MTKISRATLNISKIVYNLLNSFFHCLWRKNIDLTLSLGGRFCMSLKFKRCDYGSINM